MMGALALLVAALLAVPAGAQPASEPEAPPYALPNTHVHRIRAEALGREYELHVALPPGYHANPDRRYPVLFTTDSPQSFPIIRGIHGRLRGGGAVLEDAIIVGLGYAIGDDGVQSRRRDYTPTPHGDIDARPTMARPVVYGEAEGYRLHVRDEVFPFLEARYRIDPERRIYTGHSYGGLFGTHVLLTEPEMFRKYVLISPSLWYGRRVMIARDRAFAMRNRDLPAQLFFMIGSRETVPDPDTEPHSQSRFAMVEDMDELVSNLRSRSYPSLQLEARVIPDEDHASVYFEAIRRGMEWALPGTGRAGHQPCLDEAGQPVPFCRWPDWSRR
ncbi:MAG: alpha/beta hydrolase [Thermaurantiacus sp.]